MSKYETLIDQISLQTLQSHAGRNCNCRKFINLIAYRFNFANINIRNSIKQRFCYNYRTVL